MPHASLKLRPGANQNETPALNEAGVSSCQLIRYMQDPVQGALIQKLGGWTRYYPNTMTAIVRALWAWKDTESISHLAFGTETATSSAQLGVITDGVLSDITPQETINDIAPAVATTAGDSYPVITDTTVIGITGYDSVYITTQIAVGGIVLFGLYACDPDGYLGPTTYTVHSVDILGNSLPATSTSSLPVLPLFSTTASSSTVTVTLPEHGFVPGNTFPVLVATTVGGVVFVGNYVVDSVVDADNFTITSTETPSATTTGYLNGGDAQYIYGFGVGSISTGTGYGVGGYGTGGYGTGTAVIPSTGTPITAYDWTMDNWGEILLANPLRETTPIFQPIYQWNPESGSPIATIIAAGPPVNDGIFVAMPQRQIVAWGSTFTGVPDPLLVRWCDVNNFNVWAGTVTNQAGSYRLPKGSRIVGGIQGPQQGLLWTDIGIWSMRYIGLPFVYSFNEIGSGCGLIARKAAASLNGAVYWMGPSQFYVLAGEGVQPVPCPIWDVIFQNLDQDNLDKMRVAVNSRFGEIEWFYPSLAGGGEVDAYVKYNAFLGVWDFGMLARSAWIDQSVLGPPIGADPNTLYLYQHETSKDADGNALISNFTTGYATLSDGDLQTFIDQVWPDMKFGYYGETQNATVQITFNAVNYPGDTPRTYGPYSVTQATQFFTPRIRTRLVSLTIGSSDVGSFWRIGNVRYRYASDGKF